MRVRPRLALSVLWDLFRIPLIHRRTEPIAGAANPADSR
jgi:hypothetical protein